MNFMKKTRKLKFLKMPKPNPKRIFPFLKSKKFLTFFGLVLLYNKHEEIFTTLFGETYRKYKLNKELIERFEFSGKLKKESNVNETQMCTIYPTNLFDVSKALSLANYYKIPLVINGPIELNDDLNYSHFSLDMSNMSKINKIKNETIQIQTGTKIKELLNVLNKEGYTVDFLEKYSHSNLRIHDVLFSNYLGVSNKNTIDDYVKELTVVVPKDGRILKLKQSDAMTLSVANLKK